MSFRRRITLVSSAAVAISIALASLLVYVLTSQQLHSQLDTQLRNRGREATRVLSYLYAHPGATPGRAPSAASALGASPGALDGRILGHDARPAELTPGGLFGKLAPDPDEVRGYQQVVGAGGAILASSSTGVSLPVDNRTRALAKRGGRPLLTDASVRGAHVRLLAEGLGGGRAIQLAQPLTEVDSLLARLRLILALLDVGGIALAALLGRIVSRAAVQPLARLIQATEHVARTRDLSGRIDPAGGDEIGRLASSFNAMLDALERSIGALDASVDAQRQLVADASHELRTPVTSLRTNIEILQQQGQDMDPSEHAKLLADVVEQTEELTLVVNDLIDLARGEEPRADTEEVRLDLLLADVLARARRLRPGTPLTLEARPTVLTAVPSRLARAIGNLVDNAIKYSPPGEPVEVRLRGGRLTVRDHGPGISAEDLPHIFDRFYRGAESRGRPGSGLGLAIVRQVALQQGGRVSAEFVPGGGTSMVLELPGAELIDLPSASVAATPTSRL